MNQFCVEFMRKAVDGKTTNEVVKQKFINSLIECHENGFYLAFSAKSGWRLSNKKVESLNRQRQDFDMLIKSLFTEVK